ncbi:MAG: hypothetical protein K0Q55_4043, partial [Verrucomicrobia bacterium]|nr:hypothetical protein [Verrucomicrobiota bacterium]
EHLALNLSFPKIQVKLIADGTYEV